MTYGTPTALSGAAEAVSIDGTDLHTFGVSVDTISNPLPRAKTSRSYIPGRHGDHEFTDRYEARTMTIEGTVMGDTNAQLYENVDEFKKFLRLRENGGAFKVIFANQSTRFWLCTYNGEASFSSLGKWKQTAVMQFRLGLRCARPFAEKTTDTTEEVTLHALRNKILTYNGTMPTPLQIVVRPRVYANLLEKEAGDCNEDNTLWTYTNATGADSANGLFGTNRVQVNQTAGGAFSAEIDVTAQIDVTKWYVFAGHAQWLVGVQKIKAVVTGGTNVETTMVKSAGVGTIDFGFLKIGPTQLTGATVVQFQMLADGTDTYFTMDGCRIYEITEAEYDDADYFPPPYMSDPTGDDFVPPKNVDLQLFQSYNINPTKNGESWNPSLFPNWGVADPLGGRTKAVLFRLAATGTKNYYSDLIYLTGGVIYKVSFDYFCQVLIGSAIVVHFQGILENGSTMMDSVSVTINAVGSGWTTYQGKYTAPLGAAYGRFLVNAAADNGGRLYIKNPMIVEETAPASAYNAYVNPSLQTFEHTGTLEENDSLELDFDRMVFQRLDFSDPAMSNEAGSIVTDRLVLQPGTNVLRLQDARYGAANPHTESCGAVYARLSYRERYL